VNATRRLTSSRWRFIDRELCRRRLCEAARSRTAMKRAPTYRTPLCPVAAAHGNLLDWPSAYAAWFCPSSAHDITPFFNSDLEPVRASRAADTRALLGSSTGRKSP
jgi:hypothetical protein